MKKMLFIVVCLFLVLPGCGGGANKAKVTVLEKNEYDYVAKIECDVNNPYPTIKKTLTYIQASPDQIMEDFQKSIPADKNPGFLKDEPGFIEFTTQDGYVTITFEDSSADPNATLWIKVSTEALSQEQASAVGYYISALTEFFCPEYSEQILFQLNFFGENSKVSQIYKTVECGNIEFSYNANSEFEIRAVELPDEKPTQYLPQKPNE